MKFQCQPGLAAKQMYELLYKAPTKLMLLAGCSPVTTVFAEAAPVWNLVVVRIFCFFNHSTYNDELDWAVDKRPNQRCAGLVRLSQLLYHLHFC